MKPSVQVVHVQFWQFGPPFLAATSPVLVVQSPFNRHTSIYDGLIHIFRWSWWSKSQFLDRIELYFRHWIQHLNNSTCVCWIKWIKPHVCKILKGSSSIFRRNICASLFRPTSARSARPCPIDFSRLGLQQLAEVAGQRSVENRTHQGIQPP